jgi:hypothetical protein
MISPALTTIGRVVTLFSREAILPTQRRIFSSLCRGDGRTAVTSAAAAVPSRTNSFLFRLKANYDGYFGENGKSINQQTSIMMVALSALISLGLFETISPSSQLESGVQNDVDTDDDDDTTDVINWSGTHKVTVDNKNFWEPETVEDVQKIVKDCHERGQTVRPLGSSLSPNGIALNKEGMMSMANIDRILEIDTKNNTITVEAGVPVSKVLWSAALNTLVSLIVFSPHKLIASLVD